MDGAFPESPDTESMLEQEVVSMLDHWEKRQVGYTAIHINMYYMLQGLRKISSGGWMGIFLVSIISIPFSV